MLASALTDYAEGELAQAAELSNQGRVLVPAVVDRQPVEGAVLISGADGPDGAGHHVLAPAMQPIGQ